MSTLSLIPSFCGAGISMSLRVHQAALERGSKGHRRHGPSGQRGPRRRTDHLLQKAVDVSGRKTRRRPLQRRVMEQAEWKLLPRAVALVVPATV